MFIKFILNVLLGSVGSFFMGLFKDSQLKQTGRNEEKLDEVTKEIKDVQDSIKTSNNLDSRSDDDLRSGVLSGPKSPANENGKH